MEEYELKQKGRWIYLNPRPSIEILNKIDKEFTYIKKGAEFMINPEWAKVKLYQLGRNRFPIGLLHKFKQILKECNCNYIEKLQRLSLEDIKMEEDKLYDFQISALKMFLLRSGGILQIPTGGGKTRIAISAIKLLKTKTLVVVPTLDLVIQWKKQVNDNVEIKTYQSLKSKLYLQTFDLVIFDECHNVAAKTLQMIGLNLNEKAITLGLSATPFMRDDDNLKVESILGSIIYKISLRELIKENYLVDALVHYHKMDYLYIGFTDYPSVYEKYIVNNNQRNGKIIELAIESDGYTLILIKKIIHGNDLYNTLSMMGEDVVFLNGSTKKRDDLNHKIIIATSIFDEGIDIPHLETLIIAGGGKSAIKTTQRIGRVLRIHPGKKKALVHDFADDCKYLNNHYKERRKIYELDFEVVDAN